MRYAFVLLCCAACVELEPEESKPASTALALTPTEIDFGGERLVLVKDVLRFQYLNIPSLEESLREVRASSPGVNPCAAIAAPPQVEFRIVKRTSFTCTAVGFDEVGYAIGSTPPKRLTADWKRNREFYETGRMVVLTTSELRPTGPDHKLEAIPWAALLDAPPGTSAALGDLATAFARHGKPGERIKITLAVEDTVPLAHVFAVREALERAGLAPFVTPAG